MTETDRAAIKVHLEGATKSFHTVVDFSMRVSLELHGAPIVRSALPSIVHAKMTINGASAEELLKAPLKDHSAIIGICRMIMEASILFQYLSEGMSPEEWNCRLLCLNLHDTVNRIRLMRGFQTKDEQEALRDGRGQLITELKADPFFKTLPEDRAKALLTGEHFYLRGVNNAVGKSGWDTEKYMALYSYFSAHAHSAPMSFFRFRQQRTNFAEPSEAQQAIMVTALSVAEYSLLKATILHFNTTPQRHDRFRPQEVEEMKGGLQQWEPHFEAQTESGSRA
jgi:Family of unknown function (DUF5677)